MSEITTYDFLTASLPNRIYATKEALTVLLEHFSEHPDN